MQKKNTIIFRVDANSKIGFGHFERQFRLASFLKKKGYKIIFICTNIFTPQKKKLKKNKINLFNLDKKGGSRSDLKKTVKIIKKEVPLAVFLDGYHFDSLYQKNIYSKNYKLMVYDDFVHLKKYYCDFIINQNIYASKKLYLGRAKKCNFLMGIKYFTFNKKKYVNRKANKKNIFICLGGTNTKKILAKIIKYFTDLKHAKYKLFVLSSFIKMKKQKGLVFIKKYNENIPLLTSRCYYAITGSGNLALEMSLLKKRLLIFKLNESQKYNVSTFLKKNLAFYGGSKDKIIKKNFKKFLENKIKQKKITMNIKGHSLILNNIRKSNK